MKRTTVTFSKVGKRSFKEPALSRLFPRRFQIFKKIWKEDSRVVSSDSEKYGLLAKVRAFQAEPLEKGRSLDKKKLTGNSP